jgi:hypothetical protein
VSEIDPAEVQRYGLSAAEHERIFRERIVPDLLESRDERETPTVLFIIGDEGTDKIGAAEMVVGAFNAHGRFVDIDSALYQSYHPANDLRAAREWAAMAEEYVRVHRLNAVVREDAQDPQAVEEKMLSFRHAGALVEGMFPADPHVLSDQALAAGGFERAADLGQAPQPVPAAEESFRGVRDLAEGRQQHGAPRGGRLPQRRGQAALLQQHRRRQLGRCPARCAARSKRSGRARSPRRRATDSSPRSSVFGKRAGS